ncbi:MAG: hypothetical protein EA376_10245 [Phycisphaeraceae bacterium]|nr:MAG: hypothetical protein EA376_10245 [Phycisphaeraceae bacterium]
MKGYSPTTQTGDRSSPGLTGRPWLSIWFNCCSAYARIYRNAAGTMYEGRCPRCGGRVRALVGPNGATRRVFETE